MTTTRTYCRALSSGMITISKKALVSACLMGVHCRYNGAHKKADLSHILAEGYDPIPVCPEQIGGMQTPRPPVELTGGVGDDVLDGKARVVEVESREDKTENLLRGAEEVLDLAHFYGAKIAFLKGRSPSCGCGDVWRDGEVVEGDGVTVALLKRHGIEVRETNP